MYSIDTEPGDVWARSQDPSSGALGPRRPAFRVQGPPGTGPDGMCVDVAGNLWIAFWGTGEVRCHAPSGEVLAVVEVDAPHPSSVAFAGPQRDLLIITTASRDLSPDDLLRYPDAGRLFTARVATAGVPTASWNKALEYVRK
jgi:sugar lactone lactonase YvrE